jgi:RHS repeat-associated protein
MEKDDEVSVNGDSYDFGARIFETRLGRWLTIDPVSSKYPYLTPYAFVANSPVIAIDPDGKLIIFVNGKIGGGSPPAGEKYWNSNVESGNSDFVQGAKHYFNDYQTFYTNKDYGYLSTVKERKAQGMSYAKDEISNITQGLDKDKDVIRIVTHSMGAAFGEGMAEYLKEQGYKVETIVYINAFQAADIETIDPTSNETQTIDYQNTDDPIIELPLISKPGKVKGADAVVREKSGVKDAKTIHRSPMWNQGAKFWETLKAKITKSGPVDSQIKTQKNKSPENPKG